MASPRRSQLELLFSPPPPAPAPDWSWLETEACAEPAFGGETYEPDHDKVRLFAQLDRVWSVVQDGAWRTLAEIAQACGEPTIPEASISARLRDLRKPKFGRREVERRRRGEPDRGLHEYRVLEGPQ